MMSFLSDCVESWAQDKSSERCTLRNLKCLVSLTTPLMKTGSSIPGFPLLKPTIRSLVLLTLRTRLLAPFRQIFNAPSPLFSLIASHYASNNSDNVSKFKDGVGIKSSCWILVEKTLVHFKEENLYPNQVGLCEFRLIMIWLTLNCPLNCLSMPFICERLLPLRM